jgi:hypothetical protein
MNLHWPLVLIQREMESPQVACVRNARIILHSFALTAIREAVRQDRIFPIAEAK